MRFVGKYLLVSNSENYICNSNVSNIYVVIVITESIPLLVDYYSPRVPSAQLSYSNLQFLNNVIINKTKVLPQA
jgi:hypothetical protein